MDFITAEHCQQIIDVHFKRLNSTASKILGDFKVESFGDDGNKTGHLGEYFALEITTQGEDEETETLRLFVKKMLSAPNRPHFVNLVTRKEIAFYEWLETADCELATTCLPKYYLSTDTFVVLELLHEHRLVVRAPQQRSHLSYEHLKCAVTALAQFHALMAFAERRSPPQEALIAEAMFATATNYVYMSAITKGFVTYLKHLKHSAEVQRLFEVEIAKVISLFGHDHQRTDGTDSKTFKVVCHGDLWSNNLLFKYSSSASPEECKIIDFQLTRRAEPAHDLCTLLIHNGTFEHFGALSENYYGELMAQSAQLEMDLAEVYSKQDFEASIKTHATAALITKIIYAAFAAATQLRKVRKAQIPLDDLMALSNYNFLVDLCSMDTDYQLTFDGLIEKLITLEQNPWITEDVIARFVYKLRGNESQLLTYKVDQNVLIIDIAPNTGTKTVETLKFLVAKPHSFYEHKVGLKHVQKCYFYLKHDLMLLEHLEATHKLQNLREPFGLDDVKCSLTALAEIHATKYTHAPIKVIASNKDWNLLISGLTDLFDMLNINVNWTLVLKHVNYVSSTFAACVQHSSFNHSSIYFHKSKFDLELDTVLECKIALATDTENTYGSACEEVLTFLLCTTIKSFRHHNTKEMLTYYYNAYETILREYGISAPFTVEDFLNNVKLFEGLAILNALHYHQSALIEEKHKIYNILAPCGIKELRENYVQDPIFKERVDDVISDFCIVFDDCITI